MIRTDRHMHLALVDQAERDQATRDEVRRILGAASYPHCASGPCEQGRRRCPTPQACQRGTDNDALGAARGCVLAVVLGLVAWAVVGTVALLIGAGA